MLRLPARFAALKQPYDCACTTCCCNVLERSPACCPVGPARSSKRGSAASAGVGDFDGRSWWATGSARRLRAETRKQLRPRRPLIGDQAFNGFDSLAKAEWPPVVPGCEQAEVTAGCLRRQPRSPAVTVRAATLPESVGRRRGRADGPCTGQPRSASAQCLRQIRLPAANPFSRHHRREPWITAKLQDLGEMPWTPSGISRCGGR